MRTPFLLVALLASAPAVAQTHETYPRPVAGVDFANELTVKRVTDEAVVRPPRRPNDPLYLCEASFRTPPTVATPFGGSLRVTLFSGESGSASTRVAPGIEATLTCAVDVSAPRAGVSLLVTSVAARKGLYSSTATVWLPPPTR